MPTPKRIAAISLALKKSIGQAVPPSVEVTTLPLTTAEQFVANDTVLARVNLALIRITVSASFRNLPPRPALVSAGTLPPPLEVRYLVTVYGNAGPAAEHSVERLLEAVLQHVHEFPLLSAADLEAALPGATRATDNAVIEFDSQSDAELRDIFIHCDAKWQPALVYCVRLKQTS